MEWLLLLFLSGIVSLLFFVCSWLVVEEQIARYHEKREVIQKYNLKYIEKLQDYVKSEDVVSTDHVKLDQWAQDNGIVSIGVKKGEKWVYFSDFDVGAEEEDWEEEYGITGYSLNYYYEVEFSDGMAEVYITGIYYYTVYTAALIGDIMVSLLLFILLTMLGIRKKIRYINRLSRDIEILEGGDLEYRVHEEGRDEITNLAKGINSMKSSFRSQIEEVEDLTRKNQEMVTELSHDLRTPLTSVLLYAEILLNGKEGGERKRQEYLGKIVKKIEHMKGLADKLLQYATSASEERFVPPEYMPAEHTLYEELTDLCCYLQEQGLQAEDGLSRYKGVVCLQKEYLTRMLDNISSNILKYADRQKPVHIRDERTEEGLCISFENSCMDGEGSMDGYRIGIRNVRTLAKEMGGGCEVVQSGKSFKICLKFRFKTG